MLTAASRLALPLLLALATAAPQNQPASHPSGSATGEQKSCAACSLIQVDQQDSFAVIGLTIRTNNDAEMNGHGKISQLWKTVMNNGALDAMPHRVGNEIYVVYSDYASDATGDYNYTLGARVSSVGAIPDGYVIRRIRAGKYAVIESEQGPPQQVVPALWQNIWQMTPDELGGARAYQTDFEVYPPTTDPASIQMSAHVGLK